MANSIAGLSAVSSVYLCINVDDKILYDIVDPSENGGALQCGIAAFKIVVMIVIVRLQSPGRTLGAPPAKKNCGNR